MKPTMVINFCSSLACFPRRETIRLYRIEDVDSTGSEATPLLSVAHLESLRVSICAVCMVAHRLPLCTDD